MNNKSFLFIFYIVIFSIGILFLFSFFRLAAAEELEAKRRLFSVKRPAPPFLSFRGRVAVVVVVERTKLTRPRGSCCVEK